MKANLTKRELLRLSFIGGVGAALGLMTETRAEARTPPAGADLPPPEEDLPELAQSLSTISYRVALAFVIGAGRRTTVASVRTAADPQGAFKPGWSLIAANSPDGLCLR